MGALPNPVCKIIPVPLTTERRLLLFIFITILLISLKVYFLILITLRPSNKSFLI